MDAKWISADIAAVIAPDKKKLLRKITLVTTPEKGIEKSGVHFCYHHKDEYKKLFYD